MFIPIAHGAFSCIIWIKLLLHFWLDLLSFVICFLLALAMAIKGSNLI